MGGAEKRVLCSKVVKDRKQTAENEQSVKSGCKFTAKERWVKQENKFVVETLEKRLKDIQNNSDFVQAAKTQSPSTIWTMGYDVFVISSFPSAFLTSIKQKRILHLSLTL